MNFEIIFCEYCCKPIERKTIGTRFCDACELDHAKRKLRALQAQLGWAKNEQIVNECLRKENNHD